MEDWAKAVKKDRDVFDKEYVKEIFKAIETGIRDQLVEYDKIVFESIGLSEYFDKMLHSLQSDFDVKTIAVIDRRRWIMSYTS